MGMIKSWVLVRRLVLLLAVAGLLLVGPIRGTTRAQQTPEGGAPPAGSGPQTLSAPIRAIDGSTLWGMIHNQLTEVGIIGLDVPAGNTLCGRQTTKTLLSLTFKGPLHLTEDPQITFDSRARRMYYATTADGKDVALTLIQAGVAKADGTGNEAAQLRAAQQQAQAAHTGCLWNGSTGAPGSAGPITAPSAHAVAAPSATALPAGFVQDTIASGFVDPTNFAVRPDGSILVSQKSGKVMVWKNGAILPTPFLDLTSTTNDYGDRGLIAMALDPNYATTHYVYLAHTYEDNPTNYTGTKTAQLIRVTANGDVADPASLTVILGTEVGATCNNFPAGSNCLPSDSASHSVGNIKFAPDGTIFFTIGESAGFNAVDPTALESMDLNWMRGKVLHITATGQGLASNPFYDGNVNDNASRVWADGLRNPYRFALQPGTGTPFVGMVGWDTWESLFVMPAGANGGWPCYEGPYQQAGYAPLSQCQTLYGLGASGWDNPLYTYNHCCGSSAITAGAFYTGSSYPAPYQGAFFMGDFGQSWIKTLRVDSNNQLVPGSVQTFATGADGPVDMDLGPDGNLYYVAINTGEIRRIRYIGTNPQPTAQVSANPTSGPHPLAVQFSSAGSSDPLGGTLTYAWTFGDGGTDTTANPQHTFTADGTFTVQLTVTSPSGGTGTAQTKITVGLGGPTPTITAPASGLQYKTFDTINFAGTATDPVDSSIPASNYSWSIIMHHCPGGTCHIHPSGTFNGETSGSFQIPDHGDDTFFEIDLTVTDSRNLTGTASVNVFPQTVQVTLATTPPGLSVTYNGITQAAPLTITAVVGGTRTITTSSPQGSYAWQSWSDSGAIQHNIVVPTANTVYTAAFAAPKATTNYVVFGDALNPAWVDYSYDATTNFNVTSPVYAGTKAAAFSITTTHNGGFYLHTASPLDGTQYTTLNFAAQATVAGQQGKTFGVEFRDVNGALIGNSVYIGDYGDGPPVGAWQYYKIPLADLGITASSAKIGGIIFQEEAGAVWPNLYVDELAFANPGNPTPTPNPPPTATPTPPPNTPGHLVIYDNHLVPGWGDASWNSTVNYANTSQSHSTPDSVSLTITAAWGAFYPFTSTPLDTTPFSNLQFWARATQVNQTYDVALISPTNQVIKLVPMVDYGGVPPTSGWQLYRIPLADLNGTAIPIGGFIIQDATGGAQPPLYLDDIAFDNGANPTPATTGVSPNSIAAGAPAFTLTVNGNNFMASSTVQWNGSSRPTAFVSGSQLTAQIAAADVASAGTASVTVVNPGPGGGPSNAQTVTITQANNPAPTTTSLSPNAAAAGSGAFTLTVNGTNFISSSTVQWNASNRPTTFVSATKLTAQITAADVASAGTPTVTVVNPAPGGGTSNGQTFTIGTAPGALTLTAPVEGATGVSLTPTLQWTAPSGAVSGTTQYTVYVWDPDAQVMKFQQATTALSVNVPAGAGLVAGHFYYWAVQACNGAACGPQARWIGFTTAPGLGAPGLSSPREGATGVSTTPTLTWTAPSGATGSTQYTAYVWDPTASTMAWQGSTAALSITVPAGSALKGDHFYYYTVQACNGTSCGPLARWEGFTTGAGLGAPGLSSPAEGSTNVSLTPTLAWTAASGAVSGTQYTAYVWDPTASTMVFQQTTAALSLSVPAASALQASHFYYYSAQACTGSVCGPLARWEGFTTGTGLGAPGLLAPVEGSSGNGVTPTLRWSAASGATGGTQYTVFVWDPTVGKMMFQQTTAGLSAAVPASAGLVAGHFYYYSVQACNGTTCGPLARWEGFTS